MSNPDTSELLQTAEGRELYSYIVSCALSDGVTISADVAGADDTTDQDPYTCSNEHCTFNGAVGLAPHWADHKLDNKGRGWVSACLLSRCNANGDAVAISMRGRSNELTVAGDELVLYTAEEGAFYGDVFDASGDADTWLQDHSNACSGANNDVAHDQARDCAAQNGGSGLTYCGFNYAGDCRDFTPAFPNPYACGGYTGAPDGYYNDCHDAGTDGKKWKHSTSFREVITTYVSP